MSRIAALLAALFATAAAHAAPVSLDDGSMTIDVPDGFAQLTDAERTKMFTRGNPPDFAFASPGRDITIAVTFSSGSQTPEGLDLLKVQMEQVLEAQPDVEFIEREMIQANGQRWVHFEFTSEPAEGPAHNDIYLTSFRGRMLALSFNAQRTVHEANAQALEASFRSIRLNP